MDTPPTFPTVEPLTRQSLALLVIDMQVDFTAPGGWFDRLGIDLTPVRVAIPKIANALAFFREEGMCIVHTRQSYRPGGADLSPSLRFRSRHSGVELGAGPPGARPLTTGEPGWEIIPECRPHSGELVIDKPGYGAFPHTPLAQILRHRGIRHLAIAGVTTNCCVQSAARDALDEGFDCLLLADACAASRPDYHQRQLAMFRQLPCFTGVAPLTWLRNRLQKNTTSPPSHA